MIIDRGLLLGFLLGLSTFACPAAEPANEEAARPAASPRAGGSRLPNLVLIMTDDQWWADLGTFGATGFETPHLDRL
ncbi:MAG: sulfatase-like hydrolase/transferase, partial [Akkermansiaceae bacterium]|nr:sulfatase-like hydrolase/transferase [Akkermansiaceae bacterium]